MLKEDGLVRLDPEEFYQLKPGEQFTLFQGGQVYTVDDPAFIDYLGDRQVLYRAPDGLHAHAANHEKVWVLHPDADA